MVLPRTRPTPRRHAAALVLAVGASLFAALAAGPLAAHGAATTHTVAKGETLSQIADDLGVTPEALVQANNIKDPDRIYAGMVLRVPAAAVAASAPAANGRWHTVRPGESLSGIADHYGVDPAAIVALNGLKDPDHIVAGIDLQIPAGGGGASAPSASGAGLRRYVVRPGDSLSGIADLLGTTAEAIAAVNGIKNPSLIQVGQELSIPAATRPAASVVSHAEARAAVVAAANEFGIEPAVLLAIAWQESGFQQHVVSDVGAVGIMQLLPSTAVWAVDFLIDGGHGWQYNARDNARVGAAVFRDLLNSANGDVRLALAAYYQGWGSIERFGIFGETHDYVNNVLSLAAEFR